MQFTLTRAEFETRKEAVETQTGRTLPDDKGTITHAGVVASYDYVEPTLTVEILHKPFPLTESYVESRVSEWFRNA